MTLDSRLNLDVPKRNHSWEVEGGNAGANSEWRLVGDQVHVLGDARKHLSQQNVGVGAAVLDNLLVH